jgi:hypothetical protein
MRWYHVKNISISSQLYLSTYSQADNAYITCHYAGRIGNPGAWITASPSPIHGTGVFAAQPLHTGQIVTMAGNGKYMLCEEGTGEAYLYGLETDDVLFVGRGPAEIGDGALTMLNCAHKSHMANVQFVFYNGRMYGQVIKPVRAGQELLAWYGGQYFRTERVPASDTSGGITFTAAFLRRTGDVNARSRTCIECNCSSVCFDISNCTHCGTPVHVACASRAHGKPWKCPRCDNLK